MSKFPAEHARAVAESLVERLQPYCTRLMICGSLRRKKALVSDIELIFVSRTEQRPDPDDLFGSVAVCLGDEVIQRFVQASVVEKRPNLNGAFTWGPLNKLAIHRESGIPVDFFGTSEECWHNYLVCRTGPAELNTRIARLARERGLHWHPYEKGFTTLDNQWVVISDERQVFQTVGLAYLEPEER